jgi:nucleoside-diphosphate-sugar epimerase
MELMDAPKESIKIRTSYNLAGVSFSPADMATSIQKIYPDFRIKYNADFRQEIASKWPNSIDDSKAKEDWNWKPEYDLEAMTITMIEKLKEQYKAKQLELENIG